MLLLAGMLLGLWLPRGVLRKRPQPRPDGATADAPDRADPELAATLTGALTLGLGLLWGATSLLVGTLEDYRGWLTERFIHPPWVTYILLLMPVCSGLLLAGLVSTLVITALHGWQRVLSPHPRPARLWLTLIGGALLAAAPMHIPNATSISLLMAPLATLAAGIIAVVRKSSLHEDVGLDEFAGTTPNTRIRAMLATAASVGLAWGALLVLELPAGVDAQLADFWPAEVAVGALIGLFAAAFLSRLLDDSHAVVPILLALIATTWSLPDEGPLALERYGAGLIAALGTLCLALCCDDMWTQLGRLQSTVALAATATAAGAALALGLSAAWPAAAPAIWSSLVGLVLSAVAGLVLIFGQVGGWTRLVGLAAIVIALLLVPQHVESRAARRSTNETDHVGLPEPWSLADAHVLAGPEAWRVDLVAGRRDTITLHTDPNLRESSPNTVFRLMRRMQRALRRGGRVAIAAPTPVFAQVLPRLKWDTLGNPAPRAHLLETAHGQSLLLFGADVAEWIAYHAPSNREYDLHDLHSPFDDALLRAGVPAP